MSKYIFNYVTTMEDLLNTNHVNPTSDTLDAYVIVDDYNRLRIKGVAVYSGEEWTLYNDITDVFNKENK